jgi:hypothetical protein
MKHSNKKERSADLRFFRRAAFLYSFGTKSAKKTQNLRQNAFKPLTGGKETDTL